MPMLSMAATASRSVIVLGLAAMALLAALVPSLAFAALVFLIAWGFARSRW